MKKLLLSLSIVFISMSGWAQCNADFSDSLSTWTSNPYDVFYSNTSTGYSSWSTTFYWTFSGGASPSSSYTMDTVSVTYPGPGTYTACIFMADSITPCIDSICHSIVVSSSGLYGTVASTPTSCGACDGSATVSASGGLTPYTYLWSNASTGQSATGLCGGNYSVTITDANGDTFALSTTVPSSSPASVSISSNNNSPCAGETVTLTATATGLGNMSYLWNTGDSNSSIPATSSGMYVVTVTSSLGCTATDSINLSFGQAPSLTMTQSDESCYQCCDGTAGVSATGGSGNFTYLWSNASTMSSQTNLCPNTYSVTVTDSTLGCESTGSVSVTAFACDTIMGMITQGALARVYLIEEDNGILSAIDSTETDSLGFYYFNAICNAGTYYVKAALLPSHSMYSSYVPTYYDSSALWSLAAGLVVNSSSYYFVNFSLLSGTNPGGPGFVGGLISQGANRGEGDPVPNAQLVLFNEAGEVAAFTRSDENGEYVIDNLALGTYRLEIDILNKTSYPLHFTLTEENLTVPNGNFLVNIKSIRPELPTGISNETAKSLTIFPNPTQGRLQISANGLIESVRVMNLQGQEVLNANLPSSTAADLDLQGLSGGQYILEVIIEGEIQHHSVIKE